MAVRGVGARFLTLGLGETAARLCAFAATVYLARTLAPAHYGVVSVVAGIMLYLTQVADGGIELAGIPLVARARDHVASVVAPILSARLVLAALVVALTIPAAWLLLPDLDAALLSIAAVALFATAWSTRWVHLGLERPGSIAAARLAGELAALGMITLLVQGVDDVRLVPVAQVAGATITSLLLVVALRRAGVAVGWRWQPSAARDVFARSKHLIVFTMLGLLLFNFDLIYLRFRVGEREAGLYAAAYTLIAFAANLIVAFAHTVLPTLVRADADSAERTRVYHTTCAQAFTLALPVGIGAGFVAPELMHLVFGADYGAGAIALTVLALSIPVAALRELPVIGLLAAQREDRLLRVNALTVVANVALVLYVVPRYGIAGAAYCTLATEVLRWVLAARFAALAGFSPLPAGRMIKGIVAAAVMVGALLALRPNALWLSIVAGAASFFVALLLMRGVGLRGGVPMLKV